MYLFINILGSAMCEDCLQTMNLESKGEIYPMLFQQ